MGLLNIIADRVSRGDFAKKAVEDGADLSLFAEKPTTRIYLGIFIMAFSYAIGWPVIAFLAVLAGYLREPLIVVIGGPVTYGISHLTFMFGAYLAGAAYAHAFLRWAVRMFIEKYRRLPAGKRGDDPAPAE